LALEKRKFEEDDREEEDVDANAEQPPVQKRVSTASKQVSLSLIILDIIY